MFRVEIDAKEFARTFTDIEKTQLPFATQQATNDVAFETRGKWRELLSSQFDKPTPYTLNSALYDKANYRKGKLFAEVFIRDDTAGGRGGESFAAKGEITTGTPPAKYLQWQEYGGARRQKAFEKKLRRFPGAAQYYVAGAGAKLDAFGNVSRGTIQKVLSQLQLSERFAGSTSNETKQGKARRLKRQRKKGGGGSYFILQQNRGKLRKGVVYERVATAFGSAVRSVLQPSYSVPRYRPRLHAIDTAKKFMARRFALLFPQHLARAVASRKR